MTDPGELRHRVTLQSEYGSGDQQGGRASTWADEATVWASIEPMTGKESYTWGKLLGESTFVVRIRYRSGIASKMRLKYGSRTFDITSVIDEHEEHRFLVLGCVERT